MRARVPLIAAAMSLLLFAALPAAAQPNFIEFESGLVRPLALSPDGSQLFAVNTPDNQLEIFDVGAGGLTWVDAIQVGMEPVAVAARNNDEVWVVNHLSDSVSVIDLTATPPQVVATLLVGDEPRDIVFAGTSPRAFITTAHRGQHRTDSSISGVTGAGDPQLTTSGIGRADVWVFDPTSLGSTVGGTPDEILSFFADTPRALAVSDSGNQVYVAAFHSGNQTTVVNETVVCDGFQVSGGSGCGAGAPGGVPGPDDNMDNIDAPETGLIVKWDGSDWRDVIGRSWNSLVTWRLPDHDVFCFNANTLADCSNGTDGLEPEYDSVGTILFNMAVNPVNGKIYVTNTESPNDVRFEGPGDHGGTTVQGHLSESRISVITPSTAAVDPQHLNHHLGFPGADGIDYDDLHTDSGANHTAIDAQNQHSLATPVQPVVDSTGTTLYVAAFGSSKIGVFSTSDLENPLFDDDTTPSYDPTTSSGNYLTTTGGGPAGLALDETNNRLYVLTRFNNSVEVIDLGTSSTSATHALHNPEPDSVIEGRPFLYDATITSANGEASCSSCHIFGDMDGLAWNLGDPDGSVTANNQPSPDAFLPANPAFHPMKGPMTTQTLRGMATHGGMHWRGDRVTGHFGTDLCTGSSISNSPCDEDLSFRNFIVAFVGLVGRETMIADADMQKFADFILQVTLPPNPVRALDNDLNTSEQKGSDTWFSCGPGTTECGPLDPDATDTVEDCDGCHSLDAASGFFGSGGEQSFEAEPQHAKVPHLRNVYQKIGLFFTSNDEVRGTGILHDGSVDTVQTFVSAGVFDVCNDDPGCNAAEEQARLDGLEDFTLAFDSDLAPIVGQQVTLDAACPGDPACGRIDLLRDRSNEPFDSFILGGTVTECDLIAKGTVGGAPRGWQHDQGGSTTFTDDLGSTVTDAALRAFAVSDGPVTYTCAPPGSGYRMGIDRDEDTLLDGVETNTGIFVGPGDTGTDPAKTDTDGDGFSDPLEVSLGTDPNDPFDFPAGVPSMSLTGRAALVGLLAALASAGMLWRRRLGA